MPGAKLNKKCVNKKGMDIDLKDTKTPENIIQNDLIFKEFVNSLPQIVFEINDNGIFKFVNDKGFEEFGYTTEDFERGLNILQMIIPEDRDKVLKNIQSIRDGEKSKGNDYTALRKDGSTFPVLIYSIPLRINNKISGLRGFVVDITERKNAEELLRESEEKYRRIVDTSNEGIWAIDENHITTFVNSKMAVMLGYTPEEMVGERLDKFIFKDDLPDNLTRMKSRMEGISEVYERRYVKKDGNQMCGLVSATPVFDEKHNFKGSFVMITDISERKQNEEIIKQLNDNLKLLNKILRHDISNDLTVVSLALEMIETKNQDIKNKAFNAIQRSVDLIERVRCLESSMISRYDLKPVSVRQMTEFLNETYSKIPINISGECKMLADEAFTSVIENIVNNAIIHGKTDKIDIEISSEENICLIQIIDYGKGIPDEIKKMVFDEEFSYGENKGTGLGLYIVKNTIERYGGTIKVIDTKPHGSTFVIKLNKCIC